MTSGGFLFCEKRQQLPSKVAPHVHASGCKMRSISGGKALFVSEQGLLLNQWVGRAAHYNSRHCLPYLLAPKTRGPRIVLLPPDQNDAAPEDRNRNRRSSRRDRANREGPQGPSFFCNWDSPLHNRFR
jgi:hypothetical protein